VWSVFFRFLSGANLRDCCREAKKGDPQTDRQTIEKWLCCCLSTDVVQSLVMPYLGKHPIYDKEMFEEETFCMYDDDKKFFTEKGIQEAKPSQWFYVSYPACSRLPPKLFPSVRCMYIGTNCQDVPSSQITTFIEGLSSLFMIILDASLLLKSDFHVVHPKIRCIYILTPLFSSFSIQDWRNVLQSKTVLNCHELQLPGDVLLSPHLQTCFNSELQQFENCDKLHTYLASTYQCPNLTSFSFSSVCWNEKDTEYCKNQVVLARRLFPQLTRMSIGTNAKGFISFPFSLLATATKIESLSFPTGLPRCFKAFVLPSSVKFIEVYQSNPQQPSSLQKFLDAVALSPNTYPGLQVQINDFNSDEITQSLLLNNFDRFASLSFSRIDYYNSNKTKVKQQQCAEQLSKLLSQRTKNEKRTSFSFS
jgi:hypothetical protein